ncbi:MAG: GWxTD domain-containing protein [Bernardetiaceae bacterium]|nr:GWxTD domain-containing protein [Bernardetiaceae bacterium]
MVWLKALELERKKSDIGCIKNYHTQNNALKQQMMKKPNTKKWLQNCQKGFGYIILLFAITTCKTLTYKAENFAYIYAMHKDMHSSSAIFEQGDSLLLCISIEILSNHSELTQIKIEYLSHIYAESPFKVQYYPINSIQKKQYFTHAINLKQHTLYNDAFCRINFENKQGQNIMQRIQKYADRKLIPIPIKDFYRIGDSLQLRINENHNIDSLALFHTDQYFLPASPPMQIYTKQKQLLAQKKYFYLYKNQAVGIENIGFYFYKKQNKTIGFSVWNKEYPQNHSLNELLEPLLYLSTDKEQQELADAKELKKAMDYYWLQKAGGDKALAKARIKKFYRQVEEANRLFTNYKAGWKTDRGMIYTVLGEPQEVAFSAYSETWTYEPKPWRKQSLSFRFIKQPNDFQYAEYKLIRQSHYASGWYRSVEFWRNPTMESHMIE